MNGRTQLLRKVLWAIALLAGALQAFATRYAMNADGVSYVDIGENYFTLGWRQAISGYFSPLYSWVIGLALTVFQPSPAVETPLIHAVNFLLYIAALAGFTLFLNALLDYLRYRGFQSGAGSCSAIRYSSG
jgi:hypothetical protein